MTRQQQEALALLGSETAATDRVFTTLEGEATVGPSALEVAMRVTEFARAAGVGPEVVRYYVREGLLAPRRNPTNGYRRFGDPDVVRL